MYSVSQLFICGMNLSKNLMHKKFIVIISVTVNAVYCHPTGGVKRIPPDTAIHEQNGYAKVYITTSTTFKTNVDNDKSDTTHTDIRNK